MSTVVLVYYAILEIPWQLKKVLNIANLHIYNKAQIEKELKRDLKSALW